MPRGDKRHYTDKQKRQAEHIEEGYEEPGNIWRDEAEARRMGDSRTRSIIGGEKLWRRRLWTH